MKELITVEGGAMVDNQNLIERAVQDWIRFCDVGKLTQRAYNSAASKFVAFVTKNGLSINQETLKAFREYVKENFSVSTARLYFQISRKFCQWTCQKMNVADFTAGLKGVRVETDLHSRDALPLEDVADVINNVYSNNHFVAIRNRLALILAAELGLRRVELHRLDCGDIELRRGKYFLRIWGKARAGKNDFVALPKQAKKLLDEYLKLRAEVMKAGEVDEKAPLLISVSGNSKGRRLSLVSISKIAADALKKSNLKTNRTCLHSLRHSFASAAIQAGVDIRDVQKTLRHKSVSTSEIYVADEKFFSNNSTEIVAEKLDVYLKGGKNRG